MGFGSKDDGEGCEGFKQILSLSLKIITTAKRELR